MRPRDISDEQVAQARALRGLGKSYGEIAAELGLTVEPDSLRYHCGDVATGEKVRTRVDVERTGKDGRTIRPFDEEDDRQVLAWFNAGGLNADGETSTMADLARDLGRKRHSVAARIRTLRKHGKLPAE